jgi:signal transduction histidine kinase/ActR/RegA family two-component response regulator
MSTSLELIQKLYHVRQGGQLNRIVEQVDAVSRLLLKLFAGDFVAIFFSPAGVTEMIPVAYQAWNDDVLEGMSDLELIYRESANRTEGIKRGFTHLDSEGSSSEPEEFARKNQFVTRFRCPILVGNELRGVIVVYWKQRPTAENSNITYLVNALVEILISWMLLVEETKAADSFSLKLSTLMTLFELPLDEYPTADLAAQMTRTAKSVLRDFSVGMVSRDNISGSYRMVEFLGVGQPTQDFTDALTRSVGSLLDGLRQGSAAAKSWYDLSQELPDFGANVVAVELFRDERHQFGAVFCKDELEPLADTDLELINIFHMVAESVLSNALMVKDLRRSNDRIRESSGRLADAETMAALADMSSGIAHDFNNTIGGVIGRLQLLKMKCSEETVVASLNKIETLAMEAAATVRRLQQFSSGVKAKTLAPLDLSIVTHAYFEADSKPWQNLARQKQVNVGFSAETTEAVVNGSDDDIIQVLDRLLQNAVEYAPEHSEVRVVLSATQNQFLINVSDCGPGIPEGIRSKIFYPFFTTKGVRGAGLGLAIVYGIVTRLGGKVTIDSQVGSGTMFQVSLPRLLNSDAVTEITRKTKKSQKLRVLVVDDDDQIREILSEMLSLDGHDTTSCPDGYSALKSLGNGRYDIMITDLGMPGMSGLDLAAAAHEKSPEMPIAMITGWGTQLDHDEVTLKGIRAVLSKPFHLKDVKALVSELTSEHATETSSS